ncbi:uncharacterized protein [Diadema antillarum]|uniref:uncharacterized protein n=1 Tax=Diadema antillarum TaxID=105358 RepID=UPI003A896632
MDAIAFLLCFLFIYCGVQGGNFPPVYGSMHIAQAGDSALLPCPYSVDADHIAILQWTVNSTNSTPLAQYFNGLRLVTRKHNLTADYSLEITNLTKADSGSYACLVHTATSEADKYYYQRLRVAQNGKDTPPTHETVATAYVGGRAVLSCQDHVAADDVSIVQWTVEGADSTPLAQYFAGERYVTRKYNMTDDYSLEINNLTMSDSGVYKCFVHTSRLEADDFFKRQLNVVDKITTKPPRSPAGIIGSDVTTPKPGASKNSQKPTLWPLVILVLAPVLVVLLYWRYGAQIRTYYIEYRRRDGGAAAYSTVYNGTSSTPVRVDGDPLATPNATDPVSSERRASSDSASPVGNSFAVELLPVNPETRSLPESHPGERDRQRADHTETVIQLQQDDNASSPRVDEGSAQEPNCIEEKAKEEGEAKKEEDKEENSPRVSEVEPMIPERLQDDQADQASQVAVDMGESTEDIREDTTSAQTGWQQGVSMFSLAVNANKTLDPVNRMPTLRYNP